MAAKAIFVLCASALVAQEALGQCVGRIAEPFAPCRAGLAYDGFGFEGLGYDAAWPLRAGCGGIAPAIDISAARSLNAAYGGGLPVSSSSCAAPTGLAVASETAYEGPVAVVGNLPFLGTAAMEGVFPTAGVSAISYGCGDGAVGITAESPISAVYTPAAIAPAAITPAAIAPAAIAPAMAPWGYAGLPARGCGCGGAPYAY